VPTSERLLRHRLTRSNSDRVLLGVASGIAEWLGVDPLLVRLALLVLLTAGGLGAFLYLIAWLFSAEPAPGAPPRQQRHVSRERQIIAIGLVLVGTLLICRTLGIWFGDAVVWPIVLASGGSALIWARSSDDDRERWARFGQRLPGDPLGALLTGHAPLLRVAAGGLLLLAGAGLFLAANHALVSARGVILPAAVTVVGLALIAGPWISGLIRDAAEERRQRVRSEERAEIAAHLHDSVLHTLALIQRADAPPEIATMARRQERELRAWLAGRPAVETEQDLRGAVDALASRVEDQHHISVETVVVGEVPAVDERTRALLLACQEAVTNAARHSGAPTVSLYLEADAEGITAYVRDEGRGFELGSAAGDRRGISESIIGRMRRHGGTATIVTHPGEGTEVQLHLPRAPA